MDGRFELPEESCFPEFEENRHERCKLNINGIFTILLGVDPNSFVVYILDTRLGSLK